MFKDIFQHIIIGLLIACNLDASLLQTIQNMSAYEQQQLAPGYYDVLQKLKARIHAIEQGHFHTQELLHEELSSDEALELFGPCLGIDEYRSNPSVIRAIAESFSPSFYFYKNSPKAKLDPSDYFSQSELQEIVATARAVVDSTLPGDVLISLGQSPAYVIEAVEELLTEDNHREIYKIPFSGAPDYRCINFHYKNYKLENICTQTQLAFFKHIAKTLGIDPQDLGSDKTIYIVDLIGSGGSVASFITILQNWYTECGLQLPKIKLLDISVENRNFKNQTTVVLPVADDEVLTLERLYIHTSAHLSDKLDYTEGQDRIQPPFSASQWKPEYLEVFTQYPNAYAQQVTHCVKAACNRSR